MARIFITGSTDGLGLAAARTLVRSGHEVVLHARTKERALDITTNLGPVVIGDLSSADETRALVAQVNDLGLMDAVIHNAGTFNLSTRGETREGHSLMLAVNTLAPYILTALIDRPARLIYLSSGMHRDGSDSLDDLDWTDRPWDGTQAYRDSKLHVTALALAIARYWPDTLSNVVDPGWVPTKMGGTYAPDDLELGHLTQTWLAVDDSPSTTVTGGYWHHRQQQVPAPAASDPEFQDRLLARLDQLTGIALTAE